MGLISSLVSSYERQENLLHINSEETQGRRTCGVKSSDWSDAVTSQVMLKSSGHHQKQRKHKEGIFPEPSEGAWPYHYVDFITFGLDNCGFKPLSLLYFVIAA